MRTTNKFQLKNIAFALLALASFYISPLTIANVGPDVEHLQKNVPTSSINTYISTPVDFKDIDPTLNLITNRFEQKPIFLSFPLLINLII